MKTSAILLSLAAYFAGAQALWLCVENVDALICSSHYCSESPGCSAGHGNTENEAMQDTKNGGEGEFPVNHPGYCQNALKGSEPLKKNHETSSGNGDISYWDGNTHWYCHPDVPSNAASGGPWCCDAYGGVPLHG